MNKKPLDFTKDDIGEIMNVPLRIGIGNQFEDVISQTIEGQIINCSLANNPPYLPSSIKFKTIKDEIKSFNIFELKEYEFL